MSEGYGSECDIRIDFTEISENICIYRNSNMNMIHTSIYFGNDTNMFENLVATLWK